VAIQAVLALSLAVSTGAAEAPFTETRLRALLETDPTTGRPVDTVEALLPLLPEALRRNFALVYDSRSPFRADISRRYPRVILFTDDARFILSFTGDPRRPDRDLIETMSFDDAAATFRLEAHLLPAAERSGWRPPASALNCAGCHGADARPIYDSYPLWPGFYGSVLDTFLNDRLGRAELRAYRAFRAGPARHGVYEKLIFGERGRVPPFVDPRTLRRRTLEVDPDDFVSMPDTRLGMALTELNRKRVWRRLAAAPGYAAQAKDLLAELLECPGARRPGPSARRAVATLLRKENAQRLKRLGGRPSDPDQSIYGMEELKFTRELSEIVDVAARAGADRSDWSMALEPGALAFFDGVLSGMSGGRSYYLKEDLIFEILAHLRQGDEAFAPRFAPYPAFPKQGYPFGARLDLSKALGACPLLQARPLAHASRLRLAAAPSYSRVERRGRPAG
jgi:hypothetical protein